MTVNFQLPLSEPVEVSAADRTTLARQMKQFMAEWETGLPANASIEECLDWMAAHKLDELELLRAVEFDAGVDTQLSDKEARLNAAFIYLVDQAFHKVPA